MDKKTDKKLNRKALVLLITAAIVLAAPLTYLYLSNTKNTDNQTILSIYGKHQITVNLSLADLLLMSSVEGFGCFQNRFGNWRGQGNYTGVLVSSLVELVGGMSPGDTVTVYAEDGYNQTYCYNNVHNCWSDESVQGNMILAYTYNKTVIPEWEDGPMVVFLPPDGAYSNQDCLDTSCPGQGCNMYLSGGSRWVKNVAKIVVNGFPLNFSFAVMGDSQGNPEIFQEVIQEVGQRNPSFVIHVGDMVPSADEEQFQDFVNMINQLDAPVYKTPGNHDIRGNNTLYYTLFGSGNYSFQYRNWCFISVDTSTELIDNSQFEWLENTLKKHSSNNLFVFTHVPPFDPRPGGNHTLLNSSQATRFMSLMNSYNVRVVTAGHIHIYNATCINGTDYVISGGAGANLYAPASMGGFHHFVLFNVNNSSISFTPMPVEVSMSTPSIEVSGEWGNITLHLEDLGQMSWNEDYSSFQNFYGNWRGQGVYRGVPLSEIVNLVGGMEKTDVLTIVARDNYVQNFCYCNVCPNSSWRQLQGPMILAYTFNGTVVPEWEDGFRIVFLQPDGAYSNEDCLNTSCPGQGCNMYLSGGSRWVKNVAKIIVSKGN